MSEKEKLAVVIPCYKVKNSILNVIKTIDEKVHKIIIIDDNCPEESGLFVKKNTDDPRVEVYKNSKNLGVGGSSKRGIEIAFKDPQITHCVKIDGDGQMENKYILEFKKFMKINSLEYVKGNRFHKDGEINKMPFLRLFGNFFLSVFSKFTTGQYKSFDITNGFIAMNKNAFIKLNWKLVSDDFFFETSIAFQLREKNILTKDFNLKTIYNDEKSNLVIKDIFFPFIKNHINFFLIRLKNEYLNKNKIIFIFYFLNLLISAIFSLSVNFSYFFITILLIILFIFIDFKNLTST